MHDTTEIQMSESFVWRSPLPLTLCMPMMRYLVLIALKLLRSIPWILWLKCLKFKKRINTSMTVPLEAGGFRLGTKLGLNKVSSYSRVSMWLYIVVVIWSRGVVGNSTHIYMTKGTVYCKNKHDECRWNLYD